MAVDSFESLPAVEIYTNRKALRFALCHRRLNTLQIDRLNIPQSER